MKKNSQAKIFFWYYLPAIFWMGMIFYLSNQPGMTTGARPLSVFLERKAAHVFEYLVLSLLLIRVFRLKQFFDQWWWVRVIMIAGLYAVSDEWHQRFIPLRDGRFRDVMIDCSGIALAVISWILISSFLNEKKLDRQVRSSRRLI